MKYLFFLICCAALFAGRLPAQDRFSDCAGAVILCDKSDLIVKKLYGVGKEKAEVGYTSCSGRLDERNTVWIKWQVGESGTIEFTIEPLESADDIDFIVYRLDGDILECSRKHEIRCMASGENIGGREEESFPCKGRMGLAKNVSDTGEGDGCDDNHDNFLAAIEAKAGENYILYVNNYTSDKGFKLTWDGDATFVAPKELEAPAADKTQISKAIYFREGIGQAGLKSDWTKAPIHHAWVATCAGARVPNTFAGCMPANENSVKSEQQAKFEIGQLYPNPTAGNTKLPLTAPHNSVLRVEMFDLPGRLVFTREYIVDKGEQILELPAEPLKPGLYLALVRTGETAAVRKLVVTY